MTDHTPHWPRRAMLIIEDADGHITAWTSAPNTRIEGRLEISTPGTRGEHLDLVPDNSDYEEIKHTLIDQFDAHITIRPGPGADDLVTFQDLPHWPRTSDATTHDAVTALNALTDDDGILAAHAHPTVAAAYQAAKDRIGFWYA